MRTLVLILFIFPEISFAQTKDYKTYDKAVDYNHEGKSRKSHKTTANRALAEIIRLE